METTTSKTENKVYLWSPSSWAVWKQCPYKFHIRAQKWAKPKTKTDKRVAVMAVPGLVIDRLFELWLYRKEFDNKMWLHENYDMVWNMIIDKSKPKWKEPDEEEKIRHQTEESIEILHNLLVDNDLLGDPMGIQTEFHELITDNISIAGAIDLWSIRKDGSFVMVDFKNFQSASKRSTDQLHFYAIALEKILGRTPDEVGYVCFHPEYPGYRKRMLRTCDRNRLLARLERATAKRAAGEFKPNYNYFTCPRFCDMRFGCEAFTSQISPFLVQKQE